MFRFAERNRIALPYPSVDALRAAYRFGQLQDFLDIYYQGMAVLRTEEDYYEMTWAYLEKAHDQNVLHAEIFFDPQAHTSRGIAFKTVLDGISRAFEDGRNRLGLGTRLINCFSAGSRGYGAMGTLEQALPHRGRIIGVSLDSAEKGNPPAKFRQVFERARALGFQTVARAGEEGPAGRSSGGVFRTLSFLDARRDVSVVRDRSQRTVDAEHYVERPRWYWQPIRHRHARRELPGHVNRHRAVLRVRL
jgi:adenine deaminase